MICLRVRVAIVLAIVANKVPVSKKWGENGERMGGNKKGPMEIFP